jgi:hypothetical protein
LRRCRRCGKWTRSKYSICNSHPAAVTEAYNHTVRAEKKAAAERELETKIKAREEAAAAAAVAEYIAAEEFLTTLAAEAEQWEAARAQRQGAPLAASAPPAAGAAGSPSRPA